jgi:YidC/Oxa1 family membrane protein insertase
VIAPVIDTVPELGYYPPDLIARALDGIHLMTGMPYWQAIIVGTIAIRVLLLPSSIMGLRASSRIAAVRPEVDQLSKRMEKDPDNKSLYEAEIVHLHKKYKVSYISGFGQPLVQLPVFLSTFFALRQMGTYFPEYTSGGTLWFTDLSIADPTFVLPVASAASFLLLTELGSDDVKMQNYPWFKTVMRVMGIGIIPLTYFLPSVRFTSSLSPSLPHSPAALHLPRACSSTGAPTTRSVLSKLSLSRTPPSPHILGSFLRQPMLPRSRSLAILSRNSSR